MKKICFLLLSISIIPVLAIAQIDSSKLDNRISFKNDSLYQNGFRTAEENYKGYRTISTLTLCSSVKIGRAHV